MKLASVDLEPQFPVHVISTSFAAFKIPSLADVAEVSQQPGRLTEAVHISMFYTHKADAHMTELALEHHVPK